MKRARASAAFDAAAGPFGLKWASPSDSLRVLVDPKAPPSSAKVAAFDMDGTVITPRERTQKFPVNRGDWAWFNPAVPGELARLAKEGYHIVLLSNQGGVKSGQTTEETIMGKIFDMATELGFGFTALLALGADQYRKPAMGMWHHFVTHVNSGVAPTDFFYCGDAAGREAKWDGNSKTKKDFSCSDRKFAANIGARFVTPEEQFLRHAPTPKWGWGSAHPSELIATHMRTVGAVPQVVVKAAPLEVVILVGGPASGKSTIAKAFAAQHGYERVCNDVLGSKSKCMSVARAALAKGRSVVVDNTNPAPQLRAEWIAIAGAAGATARCIVMDTPLEICFLLNNFREATSGDKRIPDVAFHVFRKNLKKPELSEGFTAVVEYPFVVDASLPHADKAFSQWWM